MTRDELFKLTVAHKGVLANSHPDEPVFVLCARDPFAAELVELWAIRAHAAGVPNDKVQRARDDYMDFLKWPNRKNPD